jgi:hypothetical protein
VDSTVITAIYWGINAGLAALVGYLAKEKGRSRLGFMLISLVFSFVVGLIVVAVVPARPKEEVKPAEPRSSEQPVLAAQTSLAPEQRLHVNHVASLGSSQLVKCPFCAEEIRPDANLCRYCKSDVSKQRKEREAAEEKARKEQEIRLAAEAAVLEKELRHAEEKARQDAAIEAAARKEAERKALETELLRREARLKFWRSPKGTAVVLVLAAITIAGGTTAVVQVSIASSERAARMAWADKIGVCKHAPSGIRITSVTNAASMELEVRSGSDSKTITLSPAEKTFLDCLQAKVLDVHTASNQSLANTLVDSSKVLLGFDMTLEVAQPEGGSAPAKPGTVRIWSEYKNGKWFVVLSPGSDY